MSGIRLEGLTKTFGRIVAVDDVTLEFPEGKFVCLLGPSGCGKTTLLRLIAGLETPTRGRILLDGEDLTGVPPHRRNFGMVFQSLALFPHLTVGENIAYPLRIRGVDRAAQRARVEALLELIQLPGIADRPVAKLSGGQRQRVAMARALATEPRLFLLDEPLSALDAKLREAMQVELRQLQQSLAITTVLVTHDQREAMTMGDIVVVMDAGRVQQTGAPLDIYRRPANTFVADFIGTSNLIPCTVREGGAVEIAGRRLAALTGGDVPAGAATLSVRPEDVHLEPAGEGDEAGLVGRVTFVRDLGASIEMFVDCEGAEILATSTPKDRPDVHAGDRVRVEIPGDRSVVLAS